MDNDTIFKCERCGKPFAAKQGSRRTLCDKCLVARVTGKKEAK